LLLLLVVAVASGSFATTLVGSEPARPRVVNEPPRVDAVPRPDSSSVGIHRPEESAIADIARSRRSRTGHVILHRVLGLPALQRPVDSMRVDNTGAGGIGTLGSPPLRVIFCVWVV
jgi:hypothetical protein